MVSRRPYVRFRCMEMVGEETHGICRSVFLLGTQNGARAGCCIDGGLALDDFHAVTASTASSFAADAGNVIPVLVGHVEVGGLCDLGGVQMEGKIQMAVGLQLVVVRIIVRTAKSQSLSCDLGL